MLFRSIRRGYDPTTGKKIKQTKFGEPTGERGTFKMQAEGRRKVNELAQPKLADADINKVLQYAVRMGYGSGATFAQSKFASGKMPAAGKGGFDVSAMAANAKTPAQQKALKQIQDLINQYGLAQQQ